MHRACRDFGFSGYRRGGMRGQRCHTGSALCAARAAGFAGTRNRNFCFNPSLPNRRSGRIATRHSWLAHYARALSRNPASASGRKIQMVARAVSRANLLQSRSSSGGLETPGDSYRGLYCGNFFGIRISRSCRKKCRRKQNARRLSRERGGTFLIMELLLQFAVIAFVDLLQAVGDQHGRGFRRNAQHNSFAQNLPRQILH